MSTIIEMKIQPRKAEVSTNNVKEKYFIIALFICIFLYLYCDFLVIKHQLLHWPVCFFHLLWNTDDFKVVFLCNINTNHVKNTYFVWF